MRSLSCKINIARVIGRLIEMYYNKCTIVDTIWGVHHESETCAVV